MLEIKFIMIEGYKLLTLIVLKGTMSRRLWQRNGNSSLASPALLDTRGTRICILEILQTSPHHEAAPLPFV